MGSVSLCSDASNGLTIYEYTVSSVMFDTEIKIHKLARQFNKAHKQLEIPVRRPLKSIMFTPKINKLRLLCALQGSAAFAVYICVLMPSSTAMMPACMW